MALEEKLLSHAPDKPSSWWRCIDDIYLIWQHGEKKLHRFIDFLNQTHPSIKFAADCLREKVDFLKVEVIWEGD